MRGERHMWIGAYFMGPGPVDKRTVTGLIGLLWDDFSIGHDGMASFGTRPVASVSSVQDWLVRALSEQEAAPDNQVAVWSGNASPRNWCLITDTSGKAQNRSGRADDAAMFLGVNVGLVRSGHSVYHFARKAASLLMEDASIWYGFVDVSESQTVPDVSVWSGEADGLSFELSVQQALWSQYRLATRGFVRDVFWGNVLGLRLASLVLGAGLEAAIVRLETDYGVRVPWEQSPLGAVSVFLDENPATFARRRTHEMSNLADSVQAAAMLRHLWSCAGIL